MILSLLAAPHLLVHDLVLLAPPLVWLLARAARNDARAFSAASVGVIAIWALLSERKMVVNAHAGISGDRQHDPFKAPLPQPAVGFTMPGLVA